MVPRPDRRDDAVSAAPQIVIASPLDSVATAILPIGAGSIVAVPGGGLHAVEPILAGHKIALRAHAPGEIVIKLGQGIGVARDAIGMGAHVHSHNLAFVPDLSRTAPPTPLAAPSRRTAMFDGHVRDDGRVGTRNFVGVLTSVNCAATVARRIADHFTPERLMAWPGVDGVVAFGHMSGCGMAKAGAGIDNLRRTIGGYARNPNFAGIVLVGLGCEVNQIDDLVAHEALETGGRLVTLGIQDAGGTRAAIAAGIAAVEALLDRASTARRTSVSAANLTLGLQCGASDGYSALTANPALGRAVDLLVAAGGRAILSETPEIFGAQSLLLDRAVDTRVAAALCDKVAWWRDHANASGMTLDANPSPGNIAGGITTILEKSLGAVAKSGSSPLADVVDYAAPVTVPGLTFMDTPGYDPCSATGQIAGGATLIAFTTGRGSVFGSKPAPTLKLASNSALAQRMAEDIDIDCGQLLSGAATLDQLGEKIFAALLATASGKPTASERNGIGDDEFVPWVPGAWM